VGFRRNLGFTRPHGTEPVASQCYWLFLGIVATAVGHDKACARGVFTWLAWPSRYPAETALAHNPVQHGNQIASLRV
jgi:hypothetical protein